jgi:PhnB protein
MPGNTLRQDTKRLFCTLAWPWGETVIMASDVPNYQPMRSVYLSLSVDSSEEAERIYGILADGGEVYIKMGETFFAHRFGQLRDRFGTSWMVIHECPMASGA